MIGTRPFTSSTVISTTRLRSSGDIRKDSPVDPVMYSPSSLRSIRKLTTARSRFSSSFSFSSNGVSIAGMTPVMDWMPNLGIGNSGECGRSGGHGLLLLFRGFGGIDQVAGGIVVRPSIDGIAFQLRDLRLAH